MARSVHVSTRTSFEVEVDLSGSYAPGYAATLEEPGSDGEIDFDVDGIFALRFPPMIIWKDGKSQPNPERHNAKRVDLLEGLNQRERWIVGANIAHFLRDEAEELIRLEAAE